MCSAALIFFLFFTVLFLGCVTISSLRVFFDFALTTVEGVAAAVAGAAFSAAMAGSICRTRFFLGFLEAAVEGLAAGVTASVAAGAAGDGVGGIFAAAAPSRTTDSEFTLAAGAL